MSAYEIIIGIGAICIFLKKLDLLNTKLLMPSENYAQSFRSLKVGIGVLLFSFVICVWGKGHCHFLSRPLQNTIESQGVVLMRREERSCLTTRRDGRREYWEISHHSIVYSSIFNDANS